MLSLAVFLFFVPFMHLGLAIVLLKSTVFTLDLFTLCGSIYLTEDESVVSLANFCFALYHVFQLTLACLPKTPKRCRGETLLLEHLTGEWNLKQKMFS